MKVYRNVEDLPQFKNAVITIGTFDGVHEGHKKIIARLNLEADAVNGESVIVTFHPHPRKVVASAILGLRLINTLEEKIELLEKTGIDHLVIIPFNEAFANQTAEDYIGDFLVKNFHPNTIIIGYDHRFGRGRVGDYQLMEKYATIHKYRLCEIPQQVLDEVAISSTNIRKAIVQGDIHSANKLLGYDFFFEGVVVDGDKLGRRLGYPTANLAVQDDEKVVPGNGIYAVYVQVVPEETIYKGMMSIGLRPTVGGKRKVIEVNIFDFDKDIYGKIVRVYVKKYLRAEVKFDSLEELTAQIDKDKVESLTLLGDIK